MGLFDLFRSHRSEKSEVAGESRLVRAEGVSFSGLDDPALLEFIRTHQGSNGDGNRVLQNMAVLRCVSLISQTIGMLPVSLIATDKSKAKQSDNPAHILMRYRPNSFQTPFQFKSWAELSVLRHGDAYARVIMSRGKPTALIPLEFSRVKAKLNDSWQMEYTYTRKDGGTIDIPASEMFHLKDLSIDCINGISRTKFAGEAIQLALDAQRAASRQFKTGVMAGGVFEIEKELSEPAYDRLKSSLNEEYAGVENAGKWMIAEDGAKAKQFSGTAVDAQHIENRNHQIQEVARAYGIPRPLLMMDDTAWGSGIEQLGIFLVQYSLQPRFTAWEEALAQVFIPFNDLPRMQFKFNERALMRGTLKDQADYYARSLGSGGGKPWHTQNEIRDFANFPESDQPEANLLRDPVAQKGSIDEPQKTA